MPVHSQHLLAWSTWRELGIQTPHEFPTTHFGASQIFSSSRSSFLPRPPAPPGALPAILLLLLALLLLLCPYARQPISPTAGPAPRNANGSPYPRKLYPQDAPRGPPQMRMTIHIPDRGTPGRPQGAAPVSPTGGAPTCGIARRKVIESTLFFMVFLDYPKDALNAFHRFRSSNVSKRMDGVGWERWEKPIGRAH